MNGPGIVGIAGTMGITGTACGHHGSQGAAAALRSPASGEGHQRANRKSAPKPTLGPASTSLWVKTFLSVAQETSRAPQPPLPLSLATGGTGRWLRALHAHLTSWVSPCQPAGTRASFRLAELCSARFIFPPVWHGATCRTHACKQSGGADGTRRLDPLAAVRGRRAEFTESLTFRRKVMSATSQHCRHVRVCT